MSPSKVLIPVDGSPASLRALDFAIEMARQSPGASNRHSGQGRERGLDVSGARLTLRRHAVASRREVRAQDKLALETARLETAVCLGDLIEGDPLGDARPDGASCQQPEELLKVVAEPGGMSRPHHIDRVATGTLTAGQPVP